jgi:glycosyltransferase involved in cell wall biosynthesis
MTRPAPSTPAAQVRLAGTTMIAYPARPDGGGGLGHFSAGALEAVAAVAGSVTAFGPAPARRPGGRVALTSPPPAVDGWRRFYTWRRYLHGRYQYECDTAFGSWLAQRIAREPVDRAYLFTQIARESLEPLRAAGAVTVLDNPNGHIAHYRDAVEREHRRWTGWPYWGHPTAAMVARVEREYELADVIRVASEWSRRALVARGVRARKIAVVHPSIDLQRFRPPATPRLRDGPLRLVFVGSVSFGKGFPYLLTAMQRLGRSRVQLEVVGQTGDPWSRRVFQKLGEGLTVRVAPGDPAPAYARAEVLVLPTVHDGFGLVVAEAMATGLPVITTDQCGAAEWVAPDETGSVIPAGDLDALVEVLARALRHRRWLAEQGQAAHQVVRRRALRDPDPLRGFLSACWGAPVT